MASSAILYKYIIKDRKKLFIGMLTSALLSILSATFLYQLGKVYRPCIMNLGDPQL